MIDALLILFVFAFGTCLGSFLNVVIYRMPRNESIVFPSSHCTACGRKIRFHDNIPIVSWLALRGRCRFCGVKISPQYLLVEAATGAMLAGLYVCYFVLRVRTLGVGPGDPVWPAEHLSLIYAWPMFIAHAALLCGLLACAVVDIRHYIVPLPVMWTVAVIGALAVAYRPHPFLPTATPPQVAMSLAAALGLAIAELAVHRGYLIPSFLDADDRPRNVEPEKQQTERLKGKAAVATKRKGRTRSGKKAKRAGRRATVGFTAADGVRPRVEVLREVLFLTPAIVLAIGAWALLRFVPAAGSWWSHWFDPTAHPELADRLAGVGGALFAFLIGGAWIWGTRILATLGFGREAMGMGDVHILAGVGAATGWVVPSVTFFAAPVSGLAVVLYLYVRRKQRVLPYGPWLALGTVGVMLLYDGIVKYIAKYFQPGIAELFGL